MTGFGEARYVTVPYASAGVRNAGSGALCRRSTGSVSFSETVPPATWCFTYVRRGRRGRRGRGGGRSLSVMSSLVRMWRTWASTALRDLARRAPLPVDVVAHSDRHPTDVGTAADFTACEGLTNAVKHAHATKVPLHAIHKGSSLVVAVVDDGVGGAIAQEDSDWPVR